MKQKNPEDKYPVKDLKATEKILSKGLGGRRISFKSGDEAIRYLKKITKKNMKNSIFHKKMQDSKFKALYNEVATEMLSGEN